MTTGQMADAAPACEPPVSRHAWESPAAGWDAFYLVVLAAVLVIVLISTPGSTVAAAAALAALVPWYLLVGRPLWTRGPASRLRKATYVIGLFTLFAIAQSQNPEVWFLAFAFSPQFFMFLGERLAMWLGVALNFLAAGLLVLRYPSASTAAVSFGVAIAGGGFSIFYSGWVSRIIKQSEERAQIIEQLEATRVELADAQHEAGRLAERQRLSADIHDTLAQGFTSILMLIQAAQADLDGSRPQAARHLDLAAAAARDNLAEARALVADLAPAQLAGSTLPDALRRLSGAPGSQARFDLSGDPRPLPMATEVVLLRVCQEALANARQHAAAQTVGVRLGYDLDAVRVEVTDDGTGFDPDQASAPGAGTRISAEVPL
jgi:signal transduction histidine kinase